MFEGCAERGLLNLCSKNDQLRLVRASFTPPAVCWSSCLLKTLKGFLATAFFERIAQFHRNPSTNLLTWYLFDHENRFTHLLHVSNKRFDWSLEAIERVGQSEKGMNQSLFGLVWNFAWFTYRVVKILKFWKVKL